MRDWIPYLFLPISSVPLLSDFGNFENDPNSISEAKIEPMFQVSLSLLPSLEAAAIPSSFC